MSSSEVDCLHVIWPGNKTSFYHSGAPILHSRPSRPTGLLQVGPPVTVENQGRAALEKRVAVILGSRSIRTAGSPDGHALRAAAWRAPPGALTRLSTDASSSPLIERGHFNHMKDFDVARKKGFDSCLTILPPHSPGPPSSLSVRHGSTSFEAEEDDLPGDVRRRREGEHGGGRGDG